MMSSFGKEWGTCKRAQGTRWLPGGQRGFLTKMFVAALVERTRGG